MQPDTLSWEAVRALLIDLARKIAHDQVGTGQRSSFVTVYGVPRGGTFVAMLLSQGAFEVDGKNWYFGFADTPQTADYLVDDLIDSGATKERLEVEYGKPLFALLDKRTMPADKRPWVVFPWEVRDGDKDTGDIVRRMLQTIGEDTTREGLADTPARVAKAWAHWFSGYEVEDPSSILKAFEDGAEGCDEMVLQTNIPLFSHCEHHMAPIFGVAHVAYIPNGKVVGLSKVKRLVDVFARRLQVQERLTNQIADALSTGLEATGVGVVLDCRHFCMESRGIECQGIITTTSALRGTFKTEPDCRAEFMQLVSTARKGCV